MNVHIMRDRRLSIAVFALFFSWLLSFPFEGQIFYTLADSFQIDPGGMIFWSMVTYFAGLLSCNIVVKIMRAAKRLILVSIAYCAIGTSVFFLTPSFLLFVFMILPLFYPAAAFQPGLLF